MLLKPEGSIDLDYCVYLLGAASRQAIVVAAEKDGRFSILSAALKNAHSDRHSSEIRAISPHPEERLLAISSGDSGSLIVQDFNGTRLTEIAAPPLEQENPPDWLRQGFQDCYFDESGEFLWLVAPRHAQVVEIQLIETAKWSVVEKCLVEDPFGDSRCSFHETGKPDLVCLWLAAGQDGQEVYWLQKNRNGFSCDIEPCLTNTTPPSFSPSGSHVLVLNDFSAICRYDFATMRQIGLGLETGDDNNPFAESVCFLNERQALAATGQGRLFLLDTVLMKIKEEVVVEGHEPRPIREYYERLTKEKELGTDIHYFRKFGDRLFFLYGKHPRDLALRRDGLFCVSVQALG